MAASEAIKDAAAVLQALSLELADAQAALNRAIEDRDRLAKALARVAHPVPVPELKILDEERRR